jgi:uracil phosphoribosyltransferase
MVHHTAHSDATPDNVHIVDHPLAQHFLTLLRQKSTEPSQFRAVAKSLTLLIAIEASRHIKASDCKVSGILEDSAGSVFDEHIVAVVILRAGLGMLDPVIDMFPNVSVGYIGLERDEHTAVASSYYAKLPPNCTGKTVLVLDPMLATGGSASQAISLLKSHKPKEIVMMAIVAAPEGVKRLETEHPDVQVYTASLDRELNVSKYILPGLGDFGDRLYGT